MEVVMKREIIRSRRNKSEIHIKNLMDSKRCGRCREREWESVCERKRNQGNSDRNKELPYVLVYESNFENLIELNKLLCNHK